MDILTSWGGVTVPGTERRSENLDVEVRSLIARG